MSALLTRVLATVGLQRRDAPADPYSARMRAQRGREKTPRGLPEAIATTYACVQLISESIATLPLTLFEADSREPVADHPLYGVLHDMANSRQTAVEFREQLLSTCLLRGNAYARKSLDARGRVVALEILTGHVELEALPGARVRYLHDRADGSREVLLQDEVLHVRHRTVDGLVGVSPIEAARPAFELATEQQRYAQDFMRGDARPAGIFRMPDRGTLKDDAFMRLRDQIGESWSTGEPMILEDSLEFQPVTIQPREAEMILAMKLTQLDICRIFRVPPPAVGILDEATYSNITEQSSMLVKHCLRPWMVRIEQAMQMSLLTASGRRRYKIEHNAEGLLRGSQTERFEAYRVAVENGWMNVNEVRRFENMRGIGAEGDTYRRPMNSEPLRATEVAA